MSMKRTSGTPSRPICSWRWMIVITPAAARRWSARQPPLPRRHHRALPHQRETRTRRGSDDAPRGQAGVHGGDRQTGSGACPRLLATDHCRVSPWTCDRYSARGWGWRWPPASSAPRRLRSAPRRRRSVCRRRLAGVADDPLHGGAPVGAAAVELAADAIWPGAEAGVRLAAPGGRRWAGVRAGGRGRAAVRGSRVGAAVAAAVGITPAPDPDPGDQGPAATLRGTALVEDGTGVAHGRGAEPCRSSASCWPAAAGGAVRPHAPARAGEVQGPAGAALRPAEHRTRQRSAGTPARDRRWPTISGHAQEADPGRDRRPRAGAARPRDRRRPGTHPGPAAGSWATAPTPASPPSRR